MSSRKKLFTGLLAISIGFVAMVAERTAEGIAPPLKQPTQAQAQSSRQQEIEKLLQQAGQQAQQGKPQQAIVTFQQVLSLARQL